MHFRAFIGAVSLKPIQRAGFGGIDNDFRAFIGAVSLKPGSRHGGQREAERISAPSSARSH